MNESEICNQNRLRIAGNCLKKFDTWTDFAVAVQLGVVSLAPETGSGLPDVDAQHMTDQSHIDSKGETGKENGEESYDQHYPYVEHSRIHLSWCQVDLPA